jgi:hypothetical protein
MHLHLDYLYMQGICYKTCFEKHFLFTFVQFFVVVLENMRIKDLCYIVVICSECLQNIHLATFCVYKVHYKICFK